MNRPFLTVVTRCCRRPTLLRNNIRSVLAQTSRDIEQIFLVDSSGRGVVWANRNLWQQRERVIGEYVYILDDDCRLIFPDFVKRVKAFVKAVPDADVIMVRSRRPQLAPKILPRDRFWGKRINKLSARVNCLCYVVRRSYWKRHISGFAGRSGAGLFMGELLNSKATFRWLKMIVAETQQIGRGHKFEDCRQSWWRPFPREFGLERISKDDWRLRLWKQ